MPPKYKRHKPEAKPTKPGRPKLHSDDDDDGGKEVAEVKRIRKPDFKSGRYSFFDAMKNYVNLKEKHPTLDINDPNVMLNNKGLIKKNPKDYLELSRQYLINKVVKYRHGLPNYSGNVIGGISQRRGSDPYLYVDSGPDGDKKNTHPDIVNQINFQNQLLERHPELRGELRLKPIHPNYRNIPASEMIDNLISNRDRINEWTNEQGRPYETLLYSEIEPCDLAHGEDCRGNLGQLLGDGSAGFHSIDYNKLHGGVKGGVAADTIERMYKPTLGDPRFAPTKFQKKEAVPKSKVVLDFNKKPEAEVNRHPRIFDVIDELKRGAPPIPKMGAAPLPAPPAKIPIAKPAIPVAPPLVVADPEKKRKRLPDLEEGDEYRKGGPIKESLRKPNTKAKPQKARISTRERMESYFK